LIGAKIIVNGNHFQFDRKSFFNFWKTIYGFPKLNSSSLHARLISDCRNSTIVGRRNLASARIQQHPATRILPASGSGDIWSPLPEPTNQIPTGIWLEFGHGQKPAGSGKNGLDPTGFGKNGRDPAGFDRIQPFIQLDLAIYPAGSGKNGRDPTGSRGV
jgi:hypothetical protein